MRAAETQCRSRFYAVYLHHLWRRHRCGIWTFTGLLHAWHLRLRRPPQQALRPLKHCHMGAQLSRAILEFILSVADRRATWLQVAERSLL